jgi:hypothetical protein
MPTIPYRPDDQEARALTRARDDLLTRPTRIATLEAADAARTPTVQERYALHLIKQLQAARTARRATWRSAWRREGRAQAMKRTRGARVRTDLPDLAEAHSLHPQAVNR